MQLTPTQQRAIDWRGSSLLVAASAGSGKTEVLARRCVALIADPTAPCRVDQLLVVTFTRAAAAELRVRIARMLRERARLAANGPLRDHLRRQEVLVDAADIGTIDSWCGRIVREYCAEADIDPAFATLNAEAARLLREQTLERLFDWVYEARDDALAAAARAWIKRHERPADEFLRQLVRSLSRVREHMILPERSLARWEANTERDAVALAGAACDLLAETLRAECVFQAEQLDGLDAATPLPAILAKYRDEVTNWAARLANPAELQGVAEEIAKRRWTTPKDADDHTTALVHTVKTRWHQQRLKLRWTPDKLQETLDGAGEAAALLGTLLRLEARYHEQLTATKRNRAVCEYADVQRLTLGLLGQPTADGRLQPTSIAQVLRRRYADVLVDEYQDTSPLQVELLRLVTRVAPARTNRFMVGDLKQSIYGFRQAEPRLFAEQIRDFDRGAEDGSVVYLSDNFRSHRALLDALNRLFTHLFDPALGGTAFDVQERLAAGREEIANPTLDGQPRVAVHLLSNDEREVVDGSVSDENDDDVTLDRIEREAALAADEIKQLMAAGTQIVERGPDGQPLLRPLRPADIVILLRSAKWNAGLVARQMRDRQLACVTSGRETLLDSIEVQDVCNALRLVVHRREEIPLAAYLRGPLAELTPGELLEIRATSPDAAFLDAVECYRRDGIDRALVAKIGRALDQLDRWRIAARHGDLPALVRRIIRDGALESFAAAQPGGRQRVGLLEALVDYVTRFAASDAAGIAEFVEHLDEIVEQALDPGALVSGGDDAIRVMTIHASKGLEFPVVFLLNAGARFNLASQREALQFDPDLGLGLRFFDYPARRELVSAEHLCGRYARRARELEEELRLMYVATTRARERLVIIGHAAGDAWSTAQTLYASGAPLIARLSAASPLEWALMAAAASQATPEGGGDLIEVCAPEAPPPERPGTDPDRRQAAPAADAHWVARALHYVGSPLDQTLSRRPAVLSVSTLKALARATPEADAVRPLGDAADPLGAPTFVERGGARDGRAYGTACHEFLQHADLSRLNDVPAIAQEAARLVAAGLLDRSAAELLDPADLAWFGQSELGRLVAAAGDRLERELSFVYALGDADVADRTIVRGVIDCVVRSPDGLILLDYKTDRVADEAALRERVATYAVQLQAYAAAAGEIRAQPVVRAALVFLRGRTVVDVALTGAALQEQLAALEACACDPSVGD